MQFLNRIITEPFFITEGTLHQSAVGIILTEQDEVIFEVRSEKIAHQPGDICLPGGGLEPGETPEDAVIREIAEELLINPKGIRVEGPAGILVSDSLLIHSFVCRIPGYTGTFNEDEVSDVFFVPRGFFLHTEPEIHEVIWHPEMKPDFPFGRIYGGKEYAWRERVSRIRFYEYGGRVIWGMTARIMEAFIKQYEDGSGKT